MGFWKPILVTINRSGYHLKNYKNHNWEKYSNYIKEFLTRKDSAACSQKSCLDYIHNAYIQWQFQHIVLGPDLTIQLYFSVDYCKNFYIIMFWNQELLTIVNCKQMLQVCYWNNLSAQAIAADHQDVFCSILMYLFSFSTMWSLYLWPNKFIFLSNFSWFYCTQGWLPYHMISHFKFKELEELLLLHLHFNSRWRKMPCSRISQTQTSFIASCKKSCGHWQHFKICSILWSEDLHNNKEWIPQYHAIIVTD